MEERGTESWFEELFQNKSATQNDVKELRAIRAALIQLERLGGPSVMDQTLYAKLELFCKDDTSELAQPDGIIQRCDLLLAQVE